MNYAGFALGFLLLAKLFIRHGKGYIAPRWEISSTTSRRGWHRRQRLARILAGLTVAFLIYSLIAALNAAASYDSDTQLFTYRHYLAWLPHSFDARRTWFYFWMYLGLAGFFWAACDWLAGMTLAEERATRGGTELDAARSALRLPARLRSLLWLLCLNGALLGVEAIVQRASGSSKLLFLVQPLVNREGVTQFGPYAYRANAAQFFNLLWPLCLGFWWTLQRLNDRGSRSHHILLLCAAIMAACPVISTSRGGALVAAGILILAVIYLTMSELFARAWRLPEHADALGHDGHAGTFFRAGAGAGLVFRMEFT